MKVKCYPLGELQANCYFLIEGNQCLIIDPADDAPFILEEIQRNRWQMVGMLATHGHFDHLMAVGEIQLSLAIPLYINKKDDFLIKRLSETAEYFLGYKKAIFSILKIEDLSTKNFLKINNFNLKIIFTPGHTPGSCCFYLEKEKMIFTGDTLFKNSFGRYDFSYSDKNLLKTSLETLLKLPKETIVYPGHGEKTKIGDEIKLLESF